MARRRMVVWRGPSQLDGVTPTVVLATYDTRPDRSSDNAKTGSMMQTWILRDDISPVDAIRQGGDTAICGDCSHRSVVSGGTGGCYVQVWQAPQSIWLAYKRDGTRTDRRGNPTTVGDSGPFDAEAFRDRKVRFGAYGDPAAAPYEVWEAIAAVAEAATGYTHQWRRCDPQFSRRFMASCDHPGDYSDAAAKGWRSFTIRAAGTPKPAGLVQCPAAAEAGKKATCATCLQCGGTESGRTASISIEAHGVRKGRFASLPLTVVR